MKEFMSIFDSLLKRGLSASFVFIITLIITESIFFVILDNGDGSLTHWLITWKKIFSGDDKSVSLILILLSLVGLNYILLILNEIAYENTLRENFDSWLVQTPYNRTMSKNLSALREKVQEKTLNLYPDLHHITDLTDYVLYEILGGILITNTRAYVDSAKITGLVFISLISACIVSIILHYRHIGYHLIWLISLIVILYFIGRELVKTHYRSRTMRLYINFLIAPEEKILKTSGNRELGLLDPTSEKSLTTPPPISSS